MNASPSSLKLGILGCGTMAQMAHIPAFQSLENVEVAALADFRRDVADTLCRQRNIPHACGSLVEMLTHDLDAVAVLTPAPSHLADIRTALAAGKHVFTEKPAAMSVESVRQLRQARQAAGKAVMVGYMKRHEFNFRELLERRDGGAWGRLLFVRTHAFIGSHWDAAVGTLLKPVQSREVPALDPSTLDPGPVWLDAPRDAAFYGFGNPYFALLDTGSHSVNLLRHLTGITPRVTGAQFNGSVRLVQFDFDGAPGVMEFCINFAMERWDEVTELFFEKASITVRTPPPLDRQAGTEVEIYTEHDGRHDRLVLENNRRWSFRRQAEAFAAQALAGTPGNDLEEAEEDLVLIEAIYRRETGLDA